MSIVLAFPSLVVTRRSIHRLVPTLLLAPAVLFLLRFFAYPVGKVLLLSITNEHGALSIEHYTHLFESPVYARVFVNTLSIAFWTSLICIVAGYPVAYYISRRSAKERSSILIWVLLPFWTSFLVRTFAWIVLLGRNGVVNDVLSRVGFDGSLDLIYNVAGVLVGLVHALMPLAILSMIPVMDGIDRNLVAAATTLGGKSGSVFWRVYFPLSLPGVTAAGLLVFISALGFFITPALLGSPRQTMIGQIIIQQIQDLMNWGFGGAISTALLVLTIITFFVYDRVVGLSTLAGAIASRAADSRPSRFREVGRTVLRMAGILSDQVGIQVGKVTRRTKHIKTLPLVVWAVLVFLAGPALFLIPISFSTSAFIEWPPHLFSFEWFQQLMASDQWVEGAIRSLSVAGLSAALAVTLGTPVCFALLRHQIPGKTLVLAFFLAPLIVPRIVTAISLFYLFARIGLVGTSLGLVIGHAILAMPFVVITIMAVLRGHDVRLEHAAATMGAKSARILRKITLPLIAKGLIAAYLFAFVTSLDELTIALFITGGTFNTIPKLMWDDALLKVSPMLAAISVILLALVTIIIFLAERLRKN